MNNGNRVVEIREKSRLYLGKMILIIIIQTSVI